MGQVCLCLRIFNTVLTALIRTARRRNNEKNLSAQEASQKKRARLYEKNGYQKRPQGSCEKKSQGQSKTYSLIRSEQNKMIRPQGGTRTFVAVFLFQCF